MSVTLTRQEIITAVTRGDKYAQFRLYEQTFPYGLNVALHYCGSRQEAEEVLQDAYVKVFRYLETQRGVDDFKPWFRRIIINTAIDASRCKKSIQQVLPSFDISFTHNLAEQELDQQNLYTLLQYLPAKYRLVFNLYVMEGFTHPEIAELLGISVGTSKSNLSRARKRLRKLAPPYFLLDQQFSNG